MRSVACLYDSSGRLTLTTLKNALIRGLRTAENAEAEKPDYTSLDTYPRNMVL